MRTERLKYITAVVLYGTIGMFLRYIKLPSEITAMCRGAIGAVFILLFTRVRHIRLRAEAVRENRFFLLLSGVLLGLNWILLFAAYMHTTVAIASLCNYMAPILVIVAAPVILKEKLNKKKLPCVAVAFVGIILVSGVLGGETGELAGVVFGLLAALCFTAIVICNRKMRDISSYEKAIVQLAVSSVTVLPYVLVRSAGAQLHADARSVLIILMLGVVHTGFAYCLYFSGMSTLPVQTVAILGYLEPVVSVLCSVAFLHEPLTPAGWVGAVLVLGAAVLSEL